jgi:ribosomal protein L29
VKELIKARRKLKDELYTVKMKHAMKGLKQTHGLRELRRKIARINTVLTVKVKENYGNNMK